MNTETPQADRMECAPLVAKFDTFFLVISALFSLWLVVLMAALLTGVTCRLVQALL